MTDDLTFCGNYCTNTKCRRHRSNIREPQYPHSIAYLEGTEYCEKAKPTSVRLIDADAFFRNFPELAIEPYINAPTVEPDCMDEDAKQASIPYSYQMPNDYIKNKLDYSRPHGKWIRTITGHYSNYYKCSICGRTINCTLKGLEHYPFCHCGADMRGNNNANTKGT